MKPLISIITAFNCSNKDLLETIASVRCQDFGSIEYVLQDGGDCRCEDRYSALLNGLNYKYIIEKDSSLWEGMQNALRHCTGEWIYYLNAGDVLPKRSTLAEIAQFLTRTKADFLCGNWIQIDGCDDSLEKNRIIRRKCGRIEELKAKMPFSHQSIFSRASIFNNLQFRFGEQEHAVDHLLFLEAWKKGYRFERIDKTICLYKSLGYSDRRRLKSITYNIKNALRMRSSLVDIAVYTAKETVIQSLAAGKRSTYSIVKTFKCQRVFGAILGIGDIICRVLEYRLSRKIEQFPVENNSLSIHIQLDAFNISVLDMLSNKEILDNPVVLYSWKDKKKLDRLMLAQRCSIKGNPVEGRISIRYLIRECYSHIVRRTISTDESRVAKQIESTIIRRYPGLLRREIKSYERDYGRYYVMFLAYREAVRLYLLESSKKSILINDLSYFHNAAAVDAAFSCKKTILYYSAGFSDKSLYVKAAETYEELLHPTTTTKRLHQLKSERTMSCKLMRDRVVKRYMNLLSPESYHGSKAMKDFDGSDSSGKSLRQIFGIVDKRIVVIYSHILFDANSAYGRDLFDSMETWLYNTLAWYKNYGDLDCFVILKEHPANRIKEGFSGETAESKIFKDLKLDSLPERFGILKIDDKVPQRIILIECDGIITIRGSIAVEASVFGIPVLCAGSSRYSGYCFTIEPLDRNDFFASLNSFFVSSRYKKARSAAYATLYAHSVLMESGLDTAPWGLNHVEGRSPRFTLKGL